MASSRNSGTRRKRNLPGRAGSGVWFIVIGSPAFASEPVYQNYASV
jgi:hypothetical protein